MGMGKSSNWGNFAASYGADYQRVPSKTVGASGFLTIKHGGYVLVHKMNWEKTQRVFSLMS